MKLGRYIIQPKGYKAFVLYPFPPKEGFGLSPNTVQKAGIATLKLGQLNGIVQASLGEKFPTFMYMCKDSVFSCKIEGINATIGEIVEARLKSSRISSSNIYEVLNYMDALNFGLRELKKKPLDLNMIKKVHLKLMENSRKSLFSNPGYFRETQNYIMGYSPGVGRYIPPPPNEIKKSLNDLKKFLYSEDNVLPVIKAGIFHAHFETIHPFLDGNGRLGRILVVMYLNLTRILEKPILLLSQYFKNHQEVYYKKLYQYHNGDLEGWIDFFLDALIESAENTIKTIGLMNSVIQKDINKFTYSKRISSKNDLKILKNLFEFPIADVAKIREWTGFTWNGGQNVINRLIGLGILERKDREQKYARKFVYKNYLNVFYTENFH